MRKRRRLSESTLSTQDALSLVALLCALHNGQYGELIQKASLESHTKWMLKLDACIASCMLELERSEKKHAWKDTIRFPR